MARKLKLLRIALLAIFLPIVVIALALWSVPDSLYLRMLETSLIPALKSNGILLNWGSGSIEPFQISLRRITLSIPAKLLTLAADECHVGMKPTQLLRGALAFDLRCQMYAGELQFDIGLGLSGQLEQARISTRALDIARHPQIAAFGLRTALLTIDAPSLVFKDGAADGRLMLTLDKIDKPQETMLPPMLTKLPVKIPAIRDGILKLPITLSGKKLRASGVEFNSSLGECSGDFEEDPTTLSGQFIVSLRSEGSTAIGPWLPFVSQGQLTQEDRRFSLSISGTPRAPRYKYRKA